MGLREDSAGGNNVVCMLEELEDTVHCRVQLNTFCTLLLLVLEMDGFDLPVLIANPERSDYCLTLPLVSMTK